MRKLPSLFTAAAGEKYTRNTANKYNSRRRIDCACMLHGKFLKITVNVRRVPYSSTNAVRTIDENNKFFLSYEWNDVYPIDPFLLTRTTSFWLNYVKRKEIHLLGARIYGVYYSVGTRHDLGSDLKYKRLYRLGSFSTVRASVYYTNNKFYIYIVFTVSIKNRASWCDSVDGNVPSKTFVCTEHWDVFGMSTWNSRFAHIVPKIVFCYYGDVFQNRCLQKTRLTNGNHNFAFCVSVTNVPTIRLKRNRSQ